MSKNMNIKIHSLEMFNNFLSGIMQVSTACELMFDKDGIKVYNKNGSETLRGLFHSNCVTCDDPVSIYLLDIMKLKASISIIINVEKTNLATLKFDGQCISYNHVMKFKIVTDRMELVEQYKSTPLKTKLNDVTKFNCKIDNLKRFLTASSIVRTTDSKVFLYIKDGKVMAECDDRNSDNRATNSISLPITNEFDGDSTFIAPITFESFETINRLPVDNVSFTIKQTEGNVPVRVLFSDANEIVGNLNASYSIMTSLVKGK